MSPGRPPDRPPALPGGAAGWPAPAKLNLFLHITGRRADGYHTLETVFQFLDWCDLIHLCPTGDGQIRRLSALPGVEPEADLVVRAARALQAHTGCGLGVEIAVEKRLPLGGGIGGGSSDAATVLAALNVLWGLGLPLADLMGIGVRLGADVPIFLFGQAAWATGIGEELVPVAPPTPWYVVAKPACAISTREIFTHPDLPRDTPPARAADFAADLAADLAAADRDGSRAANAGGGGAGRWRNDCEALVRRLYPEVAVALDWLGPGARLTGTGACIFRPYASEAAAREKVASAPPGLLAHTARARNRSPLLDRLATANAE
jgi:4-diphosphocytidyl-2-C-methyl-D-erythritol kinase